MTNRRDFLRCGIAAGAAALSASALRAAQAKSMIASREINAMMAGGKPVPTIAPYISTRSLVNTGLPFGDATSFCTLEMDFAWNNATSHTYYVAWMTGSHIGSAGCYDIIYQSKLSGFDNGILIEPMVRYKTILTLAGKRIYGGGFYGASYGGSLSRLYSQNIGLGSVWVNPLDSIMIFGFKYTYDGVVKTYVPNGENGFVCKEDSSEITGSNWSYGYLSYEDFPEPQV